MFTNVLRNTGWLITDSDFQEQAVVLMVLKSTRSSSLFLQPSSAQQ